MNILVAEDDESLRVLLSEFLSGLGHAVRSACNGAELVTLALGGRPDLIVTDLHMPEMAGDSMVAMLDMYPDLSGIPVIIISGVSAGEVLRMGVPREIPVLPKPFDFARISIEITRVSQRRK